MIAQFFGGGEINAGASYYYTLDQLDSIREMTNSSGVIQSQYNYDPFGRVVMTGTAVSHFQYAGYYTHARTGLGLTNSRAYSSVLGRFLNRDLSGEAGGLNLYNYAGNDPISRVDPSGRQPITYGNWGGQNWADGHRGSELSNFPYLPGQKGYAQPTTPRDRCYYWHDVCLHNCARIGSSNKNDPKQPEYACNRQRCRRNCDRELACCLGHVVANVGNCGNPPTLHREIGGFEGTDPFPGQHGKSPNDNSGEFVPGLKPYQIVDPGFQNPN
ncbi:MAG TPA: RHS repeat-associated core domain-containing protein [Oculatellaceae cyanobacterium]